ncbi:MAG: hypothetical protein DDT39_01420 [Firmicutes bacterium]|nr:hypothetical protein [candidate division NPL-UPA2 bacterium]
MREEPSTSAGFGGMGPEVITRKLGTPTSRRAISGATLCVSKLVRPTGLLSLKILCKVGRRRSASISTTLLPVWAKAIAKLAVVVDLPSLGAALVTRIVLTWVSSEANWMLVRTTR